MSSICIRCLASRSFGIAHLSSINRLSLVHRKDSKTALPYIVRQYATKERTSEQKYRHGKLIVEEVEDPTLYPKFLMILSGTDEAVLDTYFNFAKKAAKMTDVDVTKSFNMPAKSETIKASTGGGDNFIEYNLKQFQRVIEISNLTGEKSDIYVGYLQKSLPAGVQIAFELKRWEMHVDPNHASLRDVDN